MPAWIRLVRSNSGRPGSACAASGLILAGFWRRRHGPRRGRPWRRQLLAGMRSSRIGLCRIPLTLSLRKEPLQQPRSQAEVQRVKAAEPTACAALTSRHAFGRPVNCLGEHSREHRSPYSAANFRTARHHSTRTGGSTIHLHTVARICHTYKPRLRCLRPAGTFLHIMT